MTSDKHITQRFPSTGATSQEQTAENTRKKRQQSHVWRIDDLLYKLVENNVKYAISQFDTSLKFNQETLANVLWDNIGKLLSDQLADDKFLEDVADSLIEKGELFKEDPSGNQTKVEGVSGDDYNALLAQIDAVVQLLKASQKVKLEYAKRIDRDKTSPEDVLKDISEIDGTIKEMSDLEPPSPEKASQIDRLVRRINSTSTRVEEHVSTHILTRNGIQKRIEELTGKASAAARTSREQKERAQGVLSSINSTLGKLGRGTSFAAKPDGGTAASSFGRWVGKLFSGSEKQKKDTKTLLGKKTANLKKKAPPSMMDKLKMRVSRSLVGKAYRGAKRVVKAVGRTIKNVASFVKKVVVKTVKAAWKAAKTFYSASKFVGGMVKGAVFGMARGIRKGMQLRRQGGMKAVGKAIQNWAPAQVLTKLGFRAIKWIGKKIWKGIKKALFKTAGLFAGLFKIGGRFINKVSTWTRRISRGIKDKATRFLIKPIASLMTSVVGFFVSILMSPINFMKWLVPTVFDRIGEVLHNIKEAAYRAYKATWSVFKKILFHPLTIGLLIGGLFLFVIPRLLGWLDGGIAGIRDSIVPAIKSISHRIWGFLKGVWSVVSTVGVFLFKAVEYITRPSGWIMKTIVFLVNTVLAIKRHIKKMMKIAGYDSIDAFCMFLSGDYLGIAIAMIQAYVKIAWNYIKSMKLFKMYMAYIKVLGGICVLIAGIVPALYESLGRAVLAAAKSTFKFLTGGGLDFSPVVEQFAKPWKRYWGIAKKLFKGAADDVAEMGAAASDQTIDADPIETGQTQKANTSIAVRNLGLKGMASEKNLEYMNSLMGPGHQKSVIDRFEEMNRIYRGNLSRAEAYASFLQEMWETSGGDPAASGEALRVMLESPDFSQRLLSAFFYYDPASGRLMTIRPSEYIGQFIQNIRNMMSDPNRDDQKAFKTLIEAFDQVNKERAHLIDEHGKLIESTAKKIGEMDMNNSLHKGEMSSIVKQINNGTFFKNNVDFQKSFDQMSRDNAATQNLTSVTGSSLGNNSLLAVSRPEGVQPGQSISLNDSDFEVKTPKKDLKNQIDNVVFPAESYPSPGPDPTDAAANAGDKTMLQLWNEHLAKMMAAREKFGVEGANRMGLKNMTFEEFKKEYNRKRPPTKEQMEQKAEEQQKRMASMRLAKNIQAFHAGGVLANPDGFRLGKTPAILKIETEGLSQNLLMFSPEWERVQGASTLSDDELLAQLKNVDSAAAKEAAKRIAQKREEEENRKKEEEARRKREQEILDYSAKVDGGFIEVKIGEDVQAMEEAWNAHLAKMMAAREQYGVEKANAMGFRNYTWEEWKKYYRKMHGLPEDGIKRIPFEGRKKERKIEWGARTPFSKDELQKFGIEFSEDGPVMIPLDKAMKVANSLLSEAKSIYSIRDGLEVMSQGLKTETDKLKGVREGGVPAAVIQTGGGDQGTTPSPPNQSQYAAVG